MQLASRFIKRVVMARLVILCVALCLLSPTLAQDAFTIALLNHINQARNAQGIPGLVWDARLITAAQRHSDDMATTDSLTHTGSDGSEFWQRMLDAGYELTQGAENVLSRSDLNARAAFEQWLNSPPHRDNMFNPNYVEVGLAYAQSASGTYYVTLLLGARPGVQPPPIQPTVTPTHTVLPSATQTPAPPTAIIPTDTPPLVEVSPIPPTLTATATTQPASTPTFAPTVTPRIMATATPFIFPPTLTPIPRGAQVFATNTPTAPPDIRLTYTDDSFTLVNVSGRVLNLRDLIFESDAGSLAMTRWETDFLSQPLTSFTARDCLQAWRINSVTVPPKPSDCRFRHAWIAVGNTAIFWADTDVFTVRNGTNRVAVCIVADGTCDVNLTTRVEAVTLPDPASVNATQVSLADVRLVYDFNSFSLVNVSGRALDLRGLQFESESGFLGVQRWDNGYLSQPLDNFTAGDCLQVWGNETGDGRPKPSECRYRHAWIVVTDTGDFWRNATQFTVLRNGQQLATCDVSARVCEVGLP